MALAPQRNYLASLLIKSTHGAARYNGGADLLNVFRAQFGSVAFYACLHSATPPRQPHGMLSFVSAGLQTLQHS